MIRAWTVVNGHTREVRNLDDIHALVSGGEGERVEFKKSTGEADRGAQTVAAMANRSGGVLVFGVDPSGQIVGQDVNERTLEKVADQLARVQPTPVTSVSAIPVGEGRSLVVVEVESGPLRPYRWNGRTFVRVGATTKEVGEEQAQQMLVEAKHRGKRWEDEPSELSVDDLDADEIQTTVQEAIRRGRLTEPEREGTVDLLRGLGLLTHAGEVTNAAAVLYGRSGALEPRLIQCQLKVARFSGTDNTARMSDEHQWVENVFSLWRRGERFMTDHLRVSAELPKDSWIRVDTPEVPPNALREALSNALAHRDYGHWSAAVTIGYFDDRIEITSPGPLRFGITPKWLYGEHHSEPWNPAIARTLYRRGTIEAWGTGFNKMVREVREAGLVAPIVTELHNAVRLTFTRPGFVPLVFKEGLSAEQVLLLDLLFTAGALSTSDIVVSVERPRRSVQRDLQLLAEQGRVELVGLTSRSRWEPVKDL